MEVGGREEKRVQRQEPRKSLRLVFGINMETAAEQTRGRMQKNLSTLLDLLPPLE